MERQIVKRYVEGFIDIFKNYNYYNYLFFLNKRCRVFPGYYESVHHIYLWFFDKWYTDKSTRARLKHSKKGSKIFFLCFVCIILQELIFVYIQLYVKRIRLFKRKSVRPNIEDVIDIFNIDNYNYNFLNYICKHKTAIYW